MSSVSVVASPWLNAATRGKSREGARVKSVEESPKDDIALTTQTCEPRQEATCDGQGGVASIIGAALADEIVAQPAATSGMPQLAQRLGLDLADALARHSELFANLFESMTLAIVEAEAQSQHMPLAFTQ